MTKTLVLYDDKGKEVMSADFVNNGEINMDDVETLSRLRSLALMRYLEEVQADIIEPVSGHGK